jgi:hypothetical protein|tara:strand:+ start:218 stop:421 length:204 start_codon:yes stop_codon:yes gene_type:complete
MKLFYNEWEKWVIIILVLFFICIGLTSCNYRPVPNETKIEYGTTDTDSKNDKLQEKKSITQTWKWIK